MTMRLEAMNVGERPQGAVSHGHAQACHEQVLDVYMQPHDKLAGVLAVENARPRHHLCSLQVFMVAHLQG